MAGELRIEIKFRYLKGDLLLDPKKFVDVIDITGDQGLHHKQSIGFAAEEALNVGDLSGTNGFFLFAVNRDATNFVEIRHATGAGTTDFLRLNPGQFDWTPLSPDASAPFAQADTAAVMLEYWLIER